jgi:homoserine kinase
MGLAFDLWDEIEAKAVTGPSRVVSRGEDLGHVAAGRPSLVLESAQRALERVGAPPVNLELNCFNRIPRGKGLGSSAAAEAAGALIVRGLIANPSVLNAGRVFQLTTEFEGHPDNAAPVVFGGATVAWMTGKRARVAQLQIDPAISAVALIPDAEMATAIARKALPTRVPHVDARFNLGRAALLVHALTADPSLLLEATEDRLHQPYRAQMMPATGEMVAQLRAAGHAAYISGAGPAVLVLTTDPDSVPEPGGWRFLRLPLASHGGTVSRVE